MSRALSVATKPDTREQIVVAAGELFWRDGYAATSLAAIAELAACHGGSVYHFFKTKEQLVVAVLQRYAELLEVRIVGAAFSRSGDPVERVFAVLGLYREMLESTARKRGCPVGNLAVEVGDHSPEARAIVDRCFDRLAEAMAESLAGAADRFPKDAAFADLGRLVLTVIEGGIVLARAKGDLTPFDASVAQLRNYFRLLHDEAKRGAAV